MNTADAIKLKYLLRQGQFTLDVDLELPMHGISGVFGASGAGKTSLLRCIAGLERPSTGMLIVAGDVWQDDASNSWRAVHERNIGYVFQEPRLFAHLDVRSNIEYGMLIFGKRVGSTADNDRSVCGVLTLRPRQADGISFDSENANGNCLDLRLTAELC